ncbi:nucleoside triphosphate pyrophosphatase [Crocosphaera sp. UHCC 0190]|uniref:Maf family protein n=1 Tax=Crocosphaera sp. UHCC 0190 TaxID=3110246 RepID=UPI002B2003C1|nr:nucleoside triphosphate pyrophosphatase [Crocosphaera sp. UHCC 0190]MEA5510400.1 nucleoside triphosphate pyrophosphatase [Crocosphaera sp. UHCC 0190]
MQLFPSFVLASASPARLKLLQTVGINPIVCHSNFDESQIQENNPQELVQILANCKAKIVAQQYPDSLVLGCDSLLVVEGEIYGKPDSPDEAIARWQKMRNNQGVLYTGHAIFDGKQHKNLSDCGTTKVHFADIDNRTIKAYVNTGEPLKCAGCFALEGKGGLFVEKIEGCHSNIIGLSLPLLRKMLQKLGYDVQDFWQNDIHLN